MGKYDSSRLKVVPVFSALLKANLWSQFFECVNVHATVGDGNCVEKTLKLPVFEEHEPEVRFGDKSSVGQGEKALPPKVDLLKWIVQNCTDSRYVKSPKQGTSQERKDLFTCPHKREEAVKAITELSNQHGITAQGEANNFPRKWYILEGASRPDVYIETATFILVIEGKLTERTFTTSTSWLKHRDQMIRHMDALYPMEGSPSKPIFGLYILPSESDYYNVFRSKDHPIFPDLPGKICRYQDFSIWKESLPHRKSDTIGQMYSHFLGYITWESLQSII